MSAQETLFESGGAAFGDLVDRQAAGVGGDDGVSGQGLFQSGHQLLLDGKVLDHRFDYPFSIFQQVEVFLEIAGGDAARGGAVDKGGRFHLEDFFEGGLHDAVFRAFLGGNIQ